jgi:hypothetical protein
LNIVPHKELGRDFKIVSVIIEDMPIIFVFRNPEPTVDHPHVLNWAQIFHLVEDFQ